MSVDYVNDTELRIVGMSRSGNHAIINWIIRQAEGRLCFLNCAEPKTNPYTSARLLMNGEPYIATYEGFDLEAERRGAFSRKDYLLHSYEDCFLGMLNNRAAAAHHDADVGASRQRRDVLILRDPFNLFASRRKAKIGGVTDPVAKRIWKQHAREFLGVRRYLDPERVLINYNRWTCDRDYRADVARQLGLTFTDEGATAVPDFGPETAFDRTAAHQRPLLQRWQHYGSDADFRALFDTEIVELAERIFGVEPAVRERLLGAASNA